MTDEEQLAMAVWNLREWGVHPSWIEYFVERGEAIEVVKKQSIHHPDHEAEHVADFFKKPQGGQTL